MTARALAGAVIVIAAVVLAVYFLIDDTPAAWLVRLSWAGAIVAGFGLALYALADLLDRRNRYPNP